MATNATVNVSLQITSGNLKYRSSPTSFQATVTKANGPTPGTITVSTSGTDISLAQLTAMGGFCVLRNIDNTNYITVGIRDSSSNRFYPWCELLPGETYIHRISRKLPKTELGTGTFSGTLEVIHAIADTAAAILDVEAFDP